MQVSPVERIVVVEPAGAVRLVRAVEAVALAVLVALMAPELLYGPAVAMGMVARELAAPEVY
ncbi:MAG TPA: hypothetical protein VGT44_02795 [Ktedonobacteraceae bacterium]|nr:hypothetical protein [Ktedonobacteraceae bacterium]